jgi:hypothetical protein
VARVFEGHHQWRFAELKGARDTCSRSSPALPA